MIKKKIVFVTYGAGHVNMLVPIIKKLQKKRHLELIVLGLTTAGITLKKNKIPYIGFKDLLEVKDKGAVKWGERLAEPYSSSSLVPYDESVAYMGLSYVELEVRYGVDEASALYQEKGRQAFFPVSIMERFLSNESPDLVVATNAPRSEQAAITAAGNLGIKSICLVDLFALQEVQWIGQSGYANKVCVLSNVVKQTLIDAGRLSEEIVVTGNPVFDQLLEYKELSSYWRKKKGWIDNLKVILWASQIEPEKHPFTDRQGNPGLPREIELEFINLMTKHPDWYLVIRAHPNEEISYDNLPENIRLSDYTDEDLYGLIASVDLVVTMTSTLGLEAALLGKPLVTIDMSIFTDDAPYSKMGISKGVSSLHKLENTLLSVFSEERLFTECLPEIGDATDKILSVIREYV